MDFIEIVKQPLYGSVYWNTIEFVYTPNEGYTGNDSFTYKRVEGDKTYLYTKYVNALNTPPIASNVSLTANARSSVVFDITDLASDPTNPFDTFIIDSITDAKYGAIKTDGHKVYYQAPYFNCQEVIYYNISDKQFLTTGIITLSVINGVDPENYKGTFENRLTTAYDLLNPVRSVSSNYNNSYDFLSTNEAYLNSINPYRWIYLYNYVFSTSADLIDLYDKLQEFTNLYSLLTTSSASWITNINPLTALDSHKEFFISTYNTVSSISSNWENNITNFSLLCSDITEHEDTYNTNSQTILDNITNWDTAEINKVLTADNVDKWNNAHTYVNFYKPVWDGVYTLANSFSTFYYNNELLFNPAYTVLNEKYVEWINTLSSYRTTLSENSAYWDTIYSRKEAYDSLYDIIQSYSSNWIKDVETSLNIKNLIELSSTNWNSYAQTILQKYEKWNNASPLSTEIAKHIPDLNSFSDTTQTNYLTTWQANNLRSILSSSSANWNSTYSILSDHYTQDWNSLYDTTTSFYVEYNKNKDYYDSIDINAIDQISNQSDFLTTILKDNSGNWNNILENTYGIELTNFYRTISDFPTDFNVNKNKFNNNNTYVNNNYLKWSNNSVEILNLSSGYWNSIFSQSSSYNNTYNTVTANSANWDVNNNINLLNNTFSAVSTNWVEYTNYITLCTTKLDSDTSSTEQISASIRNNKDKYDYAAELTTLSSSIWNGVILQDFQNQWISKFQNDYELLLNKPNSQEWDDFYVLVNGYSASYNDSKTSFDSACATVLGNYTAWSSTTAFSVMSSGSGNWNSTYNTLTSLSDGWSFNDKSSYINSYLITNPISADINYWNTTIQTYSSDWSSSMSLLAPLTADALSGSSVRSLSTNNITILGDSLFKNNISAYAGIVRINSDVIRVSSYTVYNEGTNNAVNVIKNGGYNAILNFKYQDNTVLYVKCENSTVWINLTGKPIGKALNIVGDISAYGYIYPLFDQTITTYTSKSANYQTAYSLVTSNSASIETFNTTNPNYSSFSTYYVNNLLELSGIKTRTYYNNFYSSVTAQSALNKVITDYITLSSDKFTQDTIYRQTSGKYESLYNYVSANSGLPYSEFEISNTIRCNILTKNQSIVYYVQDDITILSWSIYSEIPTNSTINILSSYYTNYNNNTSIVASAPPRLDNSNPTKNKGTDLSNTYNWLTNINKNSILKFVLTTNTAASSIIINLKAKKR